MLETKPLDGERVVVWFSCGAASTCAAKLTLEQRPDAHIVYCDVLKNEHPDNRRFLQDVEEWIGKRIEVIRSEKYDDIFDVFDKTGWLSGQHGARCTVELKRVPRERYQQPSDRHVFGYTIDELPRLQRFERNNPELILRWPLVYAGMTKQDCLDMLMRARIALPAMYLLGYRNNNCIGCVKGGAGYWNKIRRDFPGAFERMARQERKMGVSVLPNYYLDQLPTDAGNYESEYEVECGPVCGMS